MVCLEDHSKILKPTSFTAVSILKSDYVSEPVQKRQLLVTKMELRHKMTEIKQRFYAHWNRLEVLKTTLKPSREEKKAIAALLAHDKSYADILQQSDHLIKSADPSSTYCNFLLSLKEAVKQKIDYQKVLDELAKEDKVPVHQLMQELFVTHFEAPSTTTHALDAQGNDFLTIAKMHIPLT